MQVCAVCGTRDPDDPCSLVVSLRELPASHWLRVPRDAYARLLSAASFGLVLPSENCSYVTVDCCRRDIHHIYVVTRVRFKVVNRFGFGLIG